MRKIYFLLVIAILLGACNNAEKMLNYGNYDAAIIKSVKKLRKKPNDLKYTNILVEAYQRAEERDENKITFLRKEGNPANWDDIYDIYHQMKKRQDLVKTLPVIPQEIQFKNYDDELIEAKRKAAEYLVNHAEQLLQQNDKSAARQAYAELQKAKNIMPTYPGIAEKMQKAKQIGTSYVLVKMVNESNKILPKQFETELMKMVVSDLNSEWKQFYKTEDKDFQYDYIFFIKIRDISVSPEQVAEKEWVEQADVKDGWTYVYDENGNVKKDSLGNDIKVDKIIRVQANVKQVRQFKQARVAGVIDLINPYTNELLASEPLTSDVVFENNVVTFVGDKRALKKETLQMIGNQIVPFPPDETML
ncbi:MAG: hypothetical protein D6707_03640, partial [Bacteroidetes bacterium]